MARPDATPVKGSWSTTRRPGNRRSSICRTAEMSDDPPVRRTMSISLGAILAFASVSPTARSNSSSTLHDTLEHGCRVPVLTQHVRHRPVEEQLFVAVEGKRRLDDPCRSSTLPSLALAEEWKQQFAEDALIDPIAAEGDAMRSHRSKSRVLAGPFARADRCREPVARRPCGSRAAGPRVRRYRRSMRATLLRSPPV